MTLPLYDLAVATAETLLMVSLSTCFSVLIGLPLGTLLFTSRKVKRHPLLNRGITTFINISRSIPFIILLVALIPFTRLIIGTSIGMYAAMVPLTIGATPFFSRLVDNVYQSLPTGLIDASFAMGANTWQTIRFVLLPEAMPALIHAITVTAITLVNYSAMAGTVGGGGLGDLAIRYGYQRFDVGIMLATIVLLIVIVQLLQMSGDRLSTHFNHA
jgi:D-methionine transport system permease protein